MENGIEELAGKAGWKEGYPLIQNVRWLGVSTTAVKEAAIKKVGKKLTRGRAQSYPDFRKALAKATGLTDRQTISAVKIFTAEEGLPDPTKFYLYRKFEVIDGERCCFVRLPTPEEMAAYNVATESTVAEEVPA